MGRSRILLEYEHVSSNVAHRWQQMLEEPLRKQTLGRKFIPVSIGTTSVKIHHETWELWSKIKWHVFYGPRCIIDAVARQHL